MSKQVRNWGALAALAVGIVTVGAPVAFADGTETLGPASIPIASGSGIVTAGTGLASQPGTIEITIPDGATVVQALLYWTGEFRQTDDDALTVNGTEVTGALIGGPSFFYPYQGNVSAAAYRADITELGMIADGLNTLVVEDATYDVFNSGAGVLVIYDDGESTADIQVTDGLDLAFFSFPSPRDTTVPQTFTFDASDVDRVASLSVFAGSVGENRPNSITIDVAGNVTELTNPLSSADGDEWDSLVVPVDIPAGATDATVQVLSSPSDDPLGASIIWVASALSVPTEEEENSCVECDGGVSSLTLQYTGRCRANIVAYAKVGRRQTTQLFSGVVRAGETFTIDSGDVDVPLPTHVWIKVNRCVLTHIATDCSKPIGPGAKFGVFKVVEALNVGGDPICPYEPTPCHHGCGCSGSGHR